MQSAKRCLFATKDFGAFNVAFPVACAMREMGHEPVILAEGLSVAKWKSAGWNLAFEGSVNFKTEPFAFDAEAELKKHDPDVVFLTSSSPINIEASLAVAAAKLGFPQAWGEDVWGVFIRLPKDVSPQMAFVLDDASVKMLAKEPRFTNTQVVVSGNPAISNLVIPAGFPERMETLSKEHGKLVMFSGQTAEDTRDMLNVLFTSLAYVDEPFAVIPRWHPKLVTQGDNRQIWEAQVAMFDALRPGRSRIVRLDDITCSDPIAAYSDVVVGGISTTMIHAANHRRPVVSITTATTRAVLNGIVCYDRWPGLDVNLGCEITHPVRNLFDEVRSNQDRVLAGQEAYFKNPPLTPREIATKFLSLAR